MGFGLTAIFIVDHEASSPEQILDKVGLPNLQRVKTITFYETSKKWEKVFIGRKENSIILCNRELAIKSFEEENLFLGFQNTKITSIIWDESSSNFGFSLIKNGKIIRKAMVNNRRIEYDYGDPIQEEFEIKDEKIFSLEEKKEIIEYGGEEVFKEMVKQEKICRVTNLVAKRYIGTGIVQINERIELHEYK